MEADAETSSSASGSSKPATAAAAAAAANDHLMASAVPNTLQGAAVLLDDTYLSKASLVKLGRLAVAFGADPETALVFAVGNTKAPLQAQMNAVHDGPAATPGHAPPGQSASVVQPADCTTARHAARTVSRSPISLTPSMPRRSSTRSSGQGFKVDLVPAFVQVRTRASIVAPW